jgi:hypothetical protein
MISSLAGATVVTPDLDRAIAAYRDVLDYVGSPPVRVDSQQASAWGVPQAAGARMVMLRPASGEARFLRLVEGRACPGFVPLTTFGWTAIEIVVQDLRALAARLADSPFRIIGPPATLDFDFTDALSAMQVAGPGGEVLYFTQIDGEIPGFDLPRANSPVGQMFIMVLAAADIALAGAFYAALGRAAGPTIQARIDIVTDAHGLAPGHRHSLATIALEDRSLIEIDAFPPATRRRPMSDIGLPSGIAMVSMYGEARGASSVDCDDGIMMLGAAGEWVEVLGRSPR